MACRQHDAVERIIPRRPAELTADLGGVGIQRGRIAFAARGDLMRDGTTEHAPDAGDDLPDGIRRARAEVIEQGLSRPFQLREHVEMGPGEVVDMDVIAQTGAVGRGIISPEDLQRRPPAQGGRDGERDQMRLGRMVFADGAVGGRSGGIEITEGREAQPMTGGELGQTPFDRQLRRAIGVDGLLRKVFRHGHPFRDAVGRARAREDQLPDPFGEHGLQQALGADDVVLVVALRLLDRFAHVRVGGEVDDHLRGALAQGRADGGLVAHIGAEKPHPGRDRPGMPVGEVVQHGDLMPGGQRLPDAMTADVAGAPHHEHVHDGQITPGGGLRQAG